MPFVVVIYSSIYYVFMPVLILRLFLRSRKNSDYRRRLLERFGYVPFRVKSGGIHFHLVSVGETLAAVPVIEHFLDVFEKQQIPLIITSTTPTGSAEVVKRWGTRVHHCYLPFDTPGAIRRFYATLSPKATILMETELWPNVLHAAQRRGIKTILMNARLSARSAEGYRKLPSITRFMLDRVGLLICQNEASAKRFVELGMDDKRVSVSGNLKYDYVPEPEDIKKALALRSKLGESRPVWIAASTHSGEDEILIAAHKRVLQKIPDALMLLVPRHLDRFDQVAQLIIDAQLYLVRRTSREIPDPAHQIYLGDTLGELQMLYGVADVCFIGGSLVDRGGHNPIEAAVLGKPILTGSAFF